MKLSRTALAFGLGLIANTALAFGCGCGSSQLTKDAVVQAESLHPAAMYTTSWWPWGENPYDQARKVTNVFLLTYSSYFNADFGRMSEAERAQHYRVLENLRQARIRHVEGMAKLIAEQKHDPRAVDILQAHANSLKFTPDQRRTFLVDGVAWVAKAEASPDLVLRLAAQRVYEGCAKAGNPELPACFTAALAHAGPGDAGHLTTYALPSGPLTSIVARYQQLKEGRPPLVPAMQTASR